MSIPPYFSPDEQRLHENIKEAPLKMPQGLFSRDCEDLVRKLLRRNPLERLGATNGFDEVRQHPWFAGVDWQDVYKKRLPVDVYDAKTLKKRQNRIDMQALLPTSEALSRIKLKDMSLIELEGWDYQGSSDAKSESAAFVEPPEFGGGGESPVPRNAGRSGSGRSGRLRSSLA